MRSSTAVILVIDDELSSLKLLKLHLGAHGYHVLTATDAPQALKALEETPIDLVLLDIMLPGMDGFKLCGRLREKYPQLSIIVLSARTLQYDKVSALDMGADDYITKPFSMDELLARVRAALRRSGGVSSSVNSRFAFKGCVFDPSLHRLFFEEGEVVRLTPKENGLLKLLVENAGQVVTHRTLLTSVWGPEYLSDEHYLWTYARHLRRKLRDDAGEPHLLFTMPGLGYHFTQDVSILSGDELVSASGRSLKLS